MVILNPASMPAQENHPRSHAALGQPVPAVIGNGEKMRELSAVIRRVAGSNTTVLLEGESGTGKEVAAASLHHHSGRSGPFVAINCGSMSAELLDSELFGHARGAFTGATQAREGLFMHADGGTLFLDEISELPLLLQAKLLRVLETLMIRPVGTDSEVRVDVRVIAATNRAMTKLVEEGTFREDLYYRLNVLSLRIPPLRERMDDIESLVDFFANHFSEVFGLPPVPLGRGGLRKLQSHSWPGNVRELRNLVERATLLGKSPEDCLQLRALETSNLQERGGSGYPPDLTLTEVRLRHMRRILAACGGNKSEAARRIGVSRKRLERWMRDPDAD